MYIYNMPFNINQQLCRLLDNDDCWKELAGDHMKYAAFEINEIEQSSRRLAESPTNLLLSRWGNLNHRVSELFILLYRMRHIPAMHCLQPLVDERFHRLLGNGCRSRERVTASVDENGNRPVVRSKPFDSQSFLPLPVKFIEEGIMPSSSSRATNRTNGTRTDESSSVIDTLPTRENDRSRNDVNDDFMRQHVFAMPMMSYEELKEATDNWSESNLLGKGGFGQVYKGEWKLLTVAVKRLRDSADRNRELIQEMCLNQYRHDNILPLYGFCLNGPEACLVYQLMAGGSLEQRLKCKTNYPPLTWSQRHSIAHGVARGLQFLHTMTGNPLIHGDIKPANILLDQCLMPRIGDFGLARKGPYGEERTHLKVSKVHGTRPYLPDEYLRSRCLSPAVDVFSYGVVMVELATTLPALDRARPEQLLSDHIHHLARQGIDLATLEDRMLGRQGSNPELCREFIAIGLHCTQHARHSRPTMLEVYKRLNAIIAPGIKT